MNARYPVSTTGPWAQVKHHQLLAALGGALMISAVVGAAIAWNASDRSTDSRATTSSTSTFDRIEYISSPGSGFVPDLDTGAAEIDGLKAGTTRPEVVIVSPSGDSASDLYAGLDLGLVEVLDLKATRSAADAVIVSPGGDGIFDLYAGLDLGLTEIHDLKATRSSTDVAIVSPGGDSAFTLDEVAQAIAEHNAAFPALDEGTSGPAYPSSREGTRGHVTVE